jgi:3'(2'), 5'-bisphosphate nucleotidase|tara:strand:+ start:98212 stop:99051 length:840 start_codon:yes stop_codon:yes gene_type:complete
MSNRLLQHPAALTNQIRRIAYDAGEITLDYFDDSGALEAMTKDDGSPVTVADQLAEEHITKKIKEITPDILIIGEEAVAGGYRPSVENEEYYWLVDALDGTKEFISGSGNYTVNIALIHKGDPILGVVYAPFHGEMYAGNLETGALRWLDDTDSEKRIETRAIPRKGITVVSSVSHGSGEKLDTFLEQFKIEKRIKKGSSLKICTIAAGKADLYPRFGPTCEWDTAAGDAVLRAAGGGLTDINGVPLTYTGADPKFLNPEFIAWSGALAAAHQSALADE